jgi:hypothetical protein
VSLATYSDLKTAVASWLNKTNLTTQIPDLVALAESNIRRDVHTRSHETRTASTLTGETLTFPTRFMRVRSLSVGGKPMEYLSPEAYQTKVDQEYSSQGYYTIIGQSIYVLNGASGDDYILVYDASLTGFSADADTNWLLTNAPEVYLWGACEQAAVFLKDTAAAQDYNARYSAAVANLNRSERMAKYAGPLIARPEVVE